MVNTKDGRGKATVFISYAREDKGFVLTLVKDLEDRDIEAKGDWLLTPGEDYEKRLRELNLGTHAFIFIISPDSIKSKACLDELALADGHKKQILPVSHRDHHDDNLLDSALRPRQWTFLREGDDAEYGMGELVKAINTDFALMDMHGRLLVAADHWHTNGRNRSYLLRKDGLKNAEGWLAMTNAQPDKLPQATPLESEFIVASQRARSSVMRIGIGITFSVILALTVLSIVAWAQRANAIANSEEARKQTVIAKTNETEAKRQQAEAERQKQNAEENATKADNNAREAKRQQAEAEKQQMRAEKQTQIAKEEERKARELLYVSNVTLSQKAFDEGNRARGNELLDHFLPAIHARKAEDLRGFEWYYLWRSNHQELTTLKQGDSVNSVVFSPDGKVLAARGDFGKVILWNATTGTQIAMLEQPSARGAMVFSPDSKILATGSTEWRVKLWDGRTGTELLTLKGDVKTATREIATPGEQRLDLYLNDHNIIFSPDGSMLTARSSDNAVKLWNVLTGREMYRFEHAARVRSIAFSPDNKMLATGSADKTAKLWDIGSGEELNELEHVARVDKIAFSPDGEMLATASADWRSTLWNVRTGKKLFSLNENDALKQKLFSNDLNVNSLAFSPDGKRIAARSEPWKVKLWDAYTGEELATLADKGPIQRAFFSPDSTRLAAYGPTSPATIMLCDAKTGKAIKMLEDTSDANSLRFSPDSKLLAVGEEGNVKLWDASSGEELATLKGHAGGVYSMAFTPDSAMLATGSSDKTVKLWDLHRQKNELPTELSTFREYVRGNSFFSVDFSPDGKTLAVHPQGESIKFWDRDTGKELAALDGRFDSLSFSPNGKVVAACQSLSMGNYGLVSLFETQTGKKLAKLDDVSAIHALAFSPDSQILATGGDSIVKLWNTHTNRAQTKFETRVGYVRAIAFSPSGKTIAVGGQDDKAKLHDARTGRDLMTLNQGSSVVSVVFSPNGKILATLDISGVVKLWDARTGKSLGTLDASPRRVHSIAFSRDSKTLATSGEPMKLWDARTGKELVTLQHLGEVYGLAFMLDGKTLAIVTWDGTVRRFSAATDEEVNIQRN